MGSILTEATNRGSALLGSLARAPGSDHDRSGAQTGRRCVLTADLGKTNASTYKGNASTGRSEREPEPRGRWDGRRRQRACDRLFADRARSSQGDTCCRTTTCTPGGRLPIWKAADQNRKQGRVERKRPAQCAPCRTRIHTTPSLLLPMQRSRRRMPSLVGEAPLSDEIKGIAG